MVFDRFHLGAEFDLEAEALQALAQDRLGAPLRQAALERVGAAGLGEIVVHDLAQAGPQELDALDAHADAQERLDQAGPLEARQHRGLESGPARFVVRCCPAFDDARLDAVAKELAGSEQSGRSGAHDQDGW